jgi:hypothetical protein
MVRNCASFAFALALIAALGFAIIARACAEDLWFRRFLRTA